MPQEASYTLSNLEQVKILADPLRIRILEAFCEERTAKQVAEFLGEKPSKLYHHVDALERVGRKRELNEIREKLNALIKSIMAIGDAEDEEPGDAERRRLTLVYYPLKE